MNEVFAHTLAEKVRRGQALPQAVAEAMSECAAPAPTVRELLAIQARYPDAFRAEPDYKRLIL